MTRGMGKMCQIQTTDTFPWTTCLTDYKAVSTYSDFYSWAWNIAGLPHGTVHIWLGGVIDCDESYAEISALVGADITKELLLLTMYHRKQLFCYGLFRCEGVVSTDMKPKEVSTGRLLDFSRVWLGLVWGRVGWVCIKRGFSKFDRAG